MKTKTEAQEQISVFQWAETMSNRYPALALMYHIPNEGKRNARTGAYLKKQGLKAGVPDICLPVRSKNYNGLYIEMKAGNNNATALQLRWLRMLSRTGHACFICHSSDAAIFVICDYLDIDSGITYKRGFLGDIEEVKE